MSINVIVIPTEGQEHLHEIADAGNGMLADMQAVVGGYIEAVSLDMDHGLVLVGWLNEDGKGLGLAYNPAATALCHKTNAIRPDDVVVGPFFITGPPDDEGDVTTVSPFATAMVLANLVINQKGLA